MIIREIVEEIGISYGKTIFTDVLARNE